MSEPLEWDDACRWLELRKSAICAAWSKVFTDILGGQSGWSLELRVRLDDAAEKQARAERFACLYGKPGPVADDALAQLLAWRATGELSERDDIAESRMKRLLGEKLTDEEGKALRDWHRQR